MVEPLSITTGVVSLLSVCVKVGIDLKELYDGAAIADAVVKALLLEVDGFTKTLQIMKETLQQPAVQTSVHSTGHMGNHWSDISRSIQDGQNTLGDLLKTLQKVDKTVSVLDSTRKHFRMKGATPEISMYQQQIKSYRDTMQLSLQTMIM
jgi:hypothetical protein